MTPKEIEAFTSAYSVFVGDADLDVVDDFMKRYNAGEEVKPFHGYTSILDALLMWNAAIKFQLTNK